MKRKVETNFVVCSSYVQVIIFPNYYYPYNSENKIGTELHCRYYDQ